MPVHPSTALSQAFAVVISRYREEAKLTQMELAQECDLDRTYIGLLERGLANPTLKVVFELASVLGVEPAEMIAAVSEHLRSQRTALRID